jgi:hypothetical protein
MIETMIAGETNPTKLANFADRRLKATPAQLREALRGRVTKQHRFLLRLHLKQVDALEAPSLRSISQWRAISRDPARRFRRVTAWGLRIGTPICCRLLFFSSLRNLK